MNITLDIPVTHCSNCDAVQLSTSILLARSNAKISARYPDTGINKEDTTGSKWRVLEIGLPDNWKKNPASIDLNCGLCPNCQGSSNETVSLPPTQRSQPPAQVQDPKHLVYGGQAIKPVASVTYQIPPPLPTSPLPLKANTPVLFVPANTVRPSTTSGIPLTKPVLPALPQAPLRGTPSSGRLGRRRNRNRSTTPAAAFPQVPTENTANKDPVAVVQPRSANKPGVPLQIKTINSVAISNRATNAMVIQNVPAPIGTRVIVTTTPSLVTTAIGPTKAMTAVPNTNMVSSATPVATPAKISGYVIMAPVVTTTPISPPAPNMISMNGSKVVETIPMERDSEGNLIVPKMSKNI